MPQKIATFGELLWDMLPSGPRIGGAPANIAVHACDAGLDARVITALGDDILGKKIRDALAQRHFPLDLIYTDPRHPTSTVDITLNAKGHASYVIHENVAWDHIPLTADNIAFVAQADALCFGTLAQRSPVSRATLRFLLNKLPPHAVRLLDINLRRPLPAPETITTSLSAATHLKLNDEELPHLAGLHGVSKDNEKAAIGALFKKYPRLATILLTRGANGADVYLRDDSFHIDAPKIANLVDTVGAGDAFTAGYLIATLRGSPPRQAAAEGNALAAKICAIAGAWLPPGGGAGRNRGR